MTNLTVPALQQAKLLDVLALDTDVIVTKRHIRDAEEKRAGLDTDVDYLRLVREAESAEDRVDDVQRECDHLEADIAVARARIERDREREKGTNDPKELSELEDEIHSLERRIDMLETSELEALTRRDDIVAERDEIVRQRDTFHTARESIATGLTDDISGWSNRLASLSEQRTLLLAELPTEFAALYERQRERYGVGASFLQRGITSASGVQLPPGLLDEIRLADPDSVLLCPDSNAILIRTEDSGL
jgi:predicted  nucleic acid-binding Zn-ribbon protein